MIRINPCDYFKRLAKHDNLDRIVADALTWAKVLTCSLRCLHGQELAHFGPVEVLGRAGMDDLAALHDVHLVGELAAEIEILLDQQHGDAGLVAQDSGWRGRYP